MTPLNERNRSIIEEFRANGGKVGGSWTGKTLLLVHTIGKKSGVERVNPVATFRDGDRWVIIASKGGAPAHPDWYRNLVAHPTVTVEVGTEKFQARAKVTQEPERTRLYDRMVSINPGFADYRARTTRAIPVVVLERIKG